MNARIESRLRRLEKLDAAARLAASIRRYPIVQHLYYKGPTPPVPQWILDIEEGLKMQLPLRERTP